MFGGQPVFDTTHALYLWEWSYYPQFLIPYRDINAAVVVDESHTHRVKRGTVSRIGLRAGGREHTDAGYRYLESSIDGLVGRARFDWEVMDAWFEEDEQVFVHPRNPYVRIDALRSTRTVRVERDGLVLAESQAPVMVFETGLPTRYYVDRGVVDFAVLSPSETVTACPYKGQTSAYWSVEVAGKVYPDLAWSYDFPTRQLLPIAGMVAFYNEKVDVFIDGTLQPQPTTHFFE